MQIYYPVQIADGRLRNAGDARHVVHMIEQVLFTRQGQRVNVPDFGCSLDLLVFEPGNTEVVAATEARVRASLLKWLGDIIVVERVVVAADGPQITVTVVYLLLTTGERRVDTFAQ
jgi:hypothetical protein